MNLFQQLKTYSKNQYGYSFTTPKSRSYVRVVTLAHCSYENLLFNFAYF